MALRQDSETCIIDASRSSEPRAPALPCGLRRHMLCVVVSGHACPKISATDPMWCLDSTLRAKHLSWASRSHGRPATTRHSCTSPPPPMWRLAALALAHRHATRSGRASQAQNHHAPARMRLERKRSSRSPIGNVGARWPQPDLVPKAEGIRSNTRRKPRNIVELRALGAHFRVDARTFPLIEPATKSGHPKHGAPMMSVPSAPQATTHLCASVIPPVRHHVRRPSQKPQPPAVLRCDGAETIVPNIEAMCTRASVRGSHPQVHMQHPRMMIRPTIVASPACATEAAREDGLTRPLLMHGCRNTRLQSERCLRGFSPILPGSTV